MATRRWGLVSPHAHVVYMPIKQGTVPILRAAMCGGGLDELGHKVESNWVEPEPGRAALVLFELRPFDFEVGDCSVALSRQQGYLSTRMMKGAE